MTPPKWKAVSLVLHMAAELCTLPVKGTKFHRSLNFWDSRSPPLPHACAAARRASPGTCILVSDRDAWRPNESRVMNSSGADLQPGQCRDPKNKRACFLSCLNIRESLEKLGAFRVSSETVFTFNSLSNTAATSTRVGKHRGREGKLRRLNPARWSHPGGHTLVV